MVDKPLVYKLAKDYNITFNILRAEVNPKEEGVLVLEIEGSKADCDRGINFLKRERVDVQLLSEDIFMDKDKCVNCTVCVPLCPTNALVKNENFEVDFIKKDCIACGICLKACPYGAMRIEV